MSEKNPEYLSGIQTLGGLILVFVFLYGYVKLTGYGSEDTPSKPEPTFSSGAFVGCQMTIENVSLDKSETKVPTLKGQKRSDGSWEYYWGASTTPIRMPNKLGNSLIIEGSCIANNDGHVISLILDGKRIK